MNFAIVRIGIEKGNATPFALSTMFGAKQTTLINNSRKGKNSLKKRPHEGVQSNFYLEGSILIYLIFTPF